MKRVRRIGEEPREDEGVVSQHEHAGIKRRKGNDGQVVGLLEELIQATQNADINQLGCLLSLGAPVNARDKDGMTPLMHLMEAKNIGEETRIICGSLLVGSGANVNAWNKDSETALIIAASRGNIPVCEFLFRNGARDAWSETVSDLCIREIRFSSALIAATRAGHVQFMLYVLTRWHYDAAYLNYVDAEGKTALDHAREYHQPGAEAFLLEKGAKSIRELEGVEESSTDEDEVSAMDVDDNGAKNVVSSSSHGARTVRLFEAHGNSGGEGGADDAVVPDAGVMFRC